MRRAVSVAIVFTTLLVVAEWGATRMLRADVAARQIDMERTRAFQDLFFIRARDLWADIRTAAVRAHARWLATEPLPRPAEVRIALVGNSAAMFAVAPTELLRRLRARLPDRTVTLLPLMIPSATISDQHVLVRAALARSPDVVVSLIDMDGFHSEAGVASAFIADLFSEDAPARSPTASVDRWLVRHWTLYRARTVLRAIALDRVRAMLPLATDRTELDTIRKDFELIADASRRADVSALSDAYRTIGYTPPMRPHFRRTAPPTAAVFEVVDRLGRAIAGGGTTGIAIVLPFNPLLRGDQPLEPTDVRASDGVIRGTAHEAVTRLRRHGWVAIDRLDALAPTDFVDYVHVNADGMRRFTAELAALLGRLVRNESVPPR